MLVLSENSTFHSRLNAIATRLLEIGLRLNNREINLKKKEKLREAMNT